MSGNAAARGTGRTLAHDDEWHRGQAQWWKSEGVRIQLAAWHYRSLLCVYRSRFVKIPSPRVQRALRNLVPSSARCGATLTPLPWARARDRDGGGTAGQVEPEAHTLARAATCSLWLLAPP